ncbi:DUF3429 domain-containing protein [Xylophilus sp.]|uniref:DUF3429 domain-containing protein n=1 Tax=Xylophilus sp. TaxID=2653893 RepID=UPI0013BD14FF|nr:DUF3429 domain-containing protein [Xylophilus sp.]KAF1049863.1 MAG: hypothetical protein GAK38_00527 [Xylophilus sp.]
MSTAPAARTIERLAYASLAPFVVLSAFVWLVDPALLPFVSIALVGYAALSAAFLGGLHCGIGLHQGPKAPRARYLWGAASVALAWIAILMPPFAALPLLSLLLLISLLVDRRTWPEAGLGSWLPLRKRQTVVSVLACLIATGGT